jgi:hypothetical protein
LFCYSVCVTVARHLSLNLLLFKLAAPLSLRLELKTTEQLRVQLQDRVISSSERVTASYDRYSFTEMEASRRTGHKLVPTCMLTLTYCCFRMFL